MDHCLRHDKPKLRKDKVQTGKFLRDREYALEPPNTLIVTGWPKSAL
jgi:hypothetical protein